MSLQTKASAKRQTMSSSEAKRRYRLCIELTRSAQEQTVGDPVWRHYVDLASKYSSVMYDDNPDM